MSFFTDSGPSLFGRSRAPAAAEAVELASTAAGAAPQINAGICADHKLQANKGKHAIPAMYVFKPSL